MGEGWRTTGPLSPVPKGKKSPCAKRATCLEEDQPSAALSAAISHLPFSPWLYVRWFFHL